MSPSVAELLRSATALHALTLQQPWATAVAELGKDVENRVWAPYQARVGQPLAIHAGLVYDQQSAEGIRQEFGLKVPGRHACPRGAVVAVAMLAGASRDSASRWAVAGQWHWHLEGVVQLVRPVPCKGAQGLWHLPAEAFAEVRRQVLEGAGPSSAMKGVVRVKAPEDASEVRAQVRGARWCLCGAQLVRCDACGRHHCSKPGHLRHRCGLEPQWCSRCWQGFYTGPGEPEHVCEVRP
ncbi:MAG: hypothetical protein ACJ8AT_06280 [Hyalangium sp.]|uniref:hypothetical protein n=1 Tax=Hyalangium sp. TaxID=2028555 RepID=UPI00389AAA10